MIANIKETSMPRSTHPIKDYMVHSPYTIGADIELTVAVERMRESEIRHLPVQYAGKLVGILSDRDIKLALSVHPEAVNLKVSDVMTEGAFSVKEDAALESVVSTMARQKYGCAVVVNEHGRAIGIFTLVDAAQLFGKWLATKHFSEPVPAI